MPEKEPEMFRQQPHHMVIFSQDGHMDKSYSGTLNLIAGRRELQRNPLQFRN